MSLGDSGGFTPRKEFLRSQKTTSNTFALLAIAGPNLVRFYSFSDSIITGLRAQLNADRQVTGFRQDVQENMCEFSLEGKPWASGKAVNTEKLLLSILVVIYQHGYSYLSTLDYGRETDDRIAMAFSRPRLASDTSGSGSLQGSPKIPRSSLSISSDKPTIHRVPFALSFPSATVLRVISPPLHCTPAVLQAVRGSWPRGVVSEKKVGDACFEFRLKGYKWFQTDTFATDSLRHILTLLTALDAQSFTLLTSLSLANTRSRVKDLWIFTSSPPSIKDDRPDTPNSILTGDMKRSAQTSSPQAISPVSKHSSLSPHQRLATAPSPSFPQPQHYVHARAVTEGSPASPLSPNRASVLRKPAPRAQVPVSVLHEPEHTPEEYRTNLPSVISSEENNMTGVGATGYTPDVFYSSSPFGVGNDLNPSESVTGRTSQEHSSPTGTPPLQVSNSSSPSSPAEHSPQTPTNIEYSTVKGTESAYMNDGPLLGAFRDSALSSSTENTVDVPIAWTGRHDQEQNLQTPTASPRFSVGPVLPGGWASTPQVEKSEQEASPTNLAAAENVIPLSSRIESPNLREGDSGLRKSEAGMVGMFSVPHTSHSPTHPPKPKEAPSSGSQGWVVVDVDSPANTSEPGVEAEKPASSPDPLSPKIETEAPEQTLSTPALAEEASMSPAAKTIVMVDAVDAKSKNKSRSSSETSKSGMRRFFSISRKDKTPLPETDAELLAVSEAVAKSAQVEEIPPKKTKGFRAAFGKGHKQTST